MARPQKTLTPEQKVQVEALAAYLTLDQISDYLGIARSTFQEILARDAEVFGRYKKGKASAIAIVAKGLISKARAGDTASAIFYLKTQANWKETHVVEGPNGQPLNVTYIKTKHDKLNLHEGYDTEVDESEG